MRYDRTTGVCYQWAPLLAADLLAVLHEIPLLDRRAELFFVAQFACGADTLDQPSPALVTAIAIGDLFAARQ
jgi:hypothetical protein